MTNISFSSYPYKKREIYDQYLREVREIKFTAREIDIIACIIHQRQEKKIADILTIAPRTVSSHVQNILHKLGCSSRDLIIDFIEKSGKLQCVRQYYYCLIVNNLFEKHLVKIGKVINRAGLSCNLFNGKVDTKGRLQAILSYYLKLANVSLANNDSKLKPAELPDVENGPYQYNLHLFTGSENGNSLNSLEDESRQGPKDIVLVFGDGDVAMLPDVPYVDFRKKEDFYYSMLELLEKLINRPEMLLETKQFMEEYDLLKKSLHGFFAQSENNLQSKKSLIRQRLLLTFIVTCIVLAFVLLLVPNREKSEIEGINRDFAKFAKEFVADNVSSEKQKQLNYSLLHKVEQRAKLFEQEHVIKYFTSEDLPETELLNALVVLQALSNQYTYLKHDGKRARKILFVAKKIAEAFIDNKNELKINFDQLDAEELYVELNIVKDLPEMYTRVLYMLGKTYIYEHDGDLRDSLKYFNIVSKLGRKLGIFEGYMADSSCIDFVKNIEIEEHIEKSEYKEAKSKLIKIIRAFHSYLKDHREYKPNYRPGGVNEEVIIPAEDNYNIVFCSEKIIKHYSRLIMINQNVAENQKYTDKLTEVIFPKNSEINLLERNEKVTQKMSAYVLNSIGNCLLRLYNKKVNHSNLTQKLRQHFELEGIEENDTLIIAKHIFDRARSKARNTDFSKADSYDGLIRVNELLLKRENMDAARTNEIKLEIKTLTEKRDKINAELKRDGWQLRQNRI